jgi:hypothetical protein
VGLHAPGEVAFAVKPLLQRFVCRVGIDDAAKGQGSAVVKILLGDRLLCQTPVLTGKDGLWNINATLEGATDTSILGIVLEDNADGIHCDNIDLMDAGFVTPR